MRRGDFEGLVRRYLDGELEPRGFTLTPQPPADCDDGQPRAVYEAKPDDFNRRYPILAASGDAPCIDLWVELEPTTGRISAALEGPSVQEVADRLGLARRPASSAPNADLAAQLTDLAERLAELLDAAT